MTASVREQVLARVAALLSVAGATPAGGNVFRSREVSLTRATSPGIVVMPDSEEDEPMAQFADRHVLYLHVEIFTRGDPWDSLADAVATPAHRLISTDAPLRQLLLSDIRKTSSSWNAEEADRTAGVLVMRYRVTYLTQAADLSSAVY